MGRHRFDKNDAAKWGGPDLVAQDSDQSTTRPGNASPARPARNDDQSGADTGPAGDGTT